MNKKSISILIISACAVFVLCASIFIIKNNNLKKQNELNVAFYQIPETIENYLKKVIEENFEGSVIYVESEPEKKNQKSIDLYFTWKGENSTRFESICNEIPSKVLNFLPNSQKSKNTKTMPLLSDPFLLDFYIPSAEKLSLNYPQTFEELEDYLYKVSAEVFSPFFCCGGDDETLIAFVGACIQAKKGAEGYSEFMSWVENSGATGTVFDNDLIEVLDMLKVWAKKGLIHPMWYVAKENDVDFFTEQKQVGVLFTSLSNHRILKYNVTKNFQTMKFPNSKKLTNNVETGIPGKEIVCMNFNKSINCKAILLKLVSEEIQGNLSNVSMLAPVALKGEAYDLQADDSRFFIASCAGGLLPVIKNNKAANMIRDYLKKINE